MSGTLSLRFQRFVLSQPGCVAADSGSATATLHSAPSVPHAQDAHQFISTYVYTESAVFPGIPFGSDLNCTYTKKRSLSGLRYRLRGNQ